ncbi:MAG: hypothetical protein M3032_06810 [Verrucomicrobiota bacterium]|nr:hypothetical protein [Verrucomicrobiota bacterium]
MEQLRRADLAAEHASLRGGWKTGAEDFADWLATKLARSGRPGERARERRETDEALAERLVKSGLREAGWTEEDVSRGPKGDPVKVALARQLRMQTSMTRSWIARRLQMGSASYVSNLVGRVDSKL